MMFQRYPLQGTYLDVPLLAVLGASAEKRRTYVSELIAAFADEAAFGTLALKRKVGIATIARDLSHLNGIATDKYLFTDDDTLKRDVLGKGGPGATHANLSRHHMWTMATKIGNLAESLEFGCIKLANALFKLFDPANKSKECFRNPTRGAIENALTYLQIQMGSGSAFPPVHARFFADKYLPTAGDSIVVDPCAGWGGRLAGTLLVPRADTVQFYGIDPEERNRRAYEGITKIITGKLSDEIWGKREAHFAYMPFEDWINTGEAAGIQGNADLVITSPPYASAEIYNPDNPEQSANRYKTYADWQQGFLKPLIEGAHALLKPGGHFVLNIANVREAPNLEEDACNLAVKAGFEAAGTYQLALSRSPGNRKAGRNVRTVTVDGVQYKREPVFCFQAA